MSYQVDCKPPPRGAENPYSQVSAYMEKIWEAQDWLFEQNIRKYYNDEDHYEIFIFENAQDALLFKMYWG